VAGRDDGVLAQRDAVAVADLVAGLAGGPRELLVEGALEATERLVGAHEADQVGGDVVGRVVADRVLAQRDALEALLLQVVDDLGGQRGGDAAGDVLEPAALDPEPAKGRDVVDVEPLGEQLGQLGGVVGRHHRVGDHHPAVDRVGQRHPVAVQDVAPLGREDHLLDALGGRHRGVRPRVDPLQLHEAGAEERQHDRDHDEAEAQPEHRRPAVGTDRSAPTPLRTLARTGSRLLPGPGQLGSVLGVWSGNGVANGPRSRFYLLTQARAARPRRQGC
jgi:hypothetical protein